jgi:hypothetical protein
MWVYPNQVIQNDNWATNTGIDILLAMGENDGLYIYNTSPINLLHLGMPSEVVNCEVRVQGTGSLFTPQLLLNFYRGGILIDSISVPTTNDWVVHTLTVDRWDSVELLVGIGGTVAVDFLRAEPYGGSPTKRTLTGVGI